jgi:hypothetical protein
MISMTLTRCLGLVLVILLGMTVLAVAQTVEEYKTAVEAMKRKEGCLSIPQADLRDRCTRASDFVEQDCKRKEYGCKGLENKELANNIKGKEEAIESMKRQKSALDSERSGALDSEKAQIERSAKALDDRINRELSGLEEMKKALETDRSDSGIRADQGKRCLEARNDVQALFASASSAAKSESDAEKKPYADDLVKYWEQGARDHEEAQKLTQQAIEYCGKTKSGDL